VLIVPPLRRPGGMALCKVLLATLLQLASCIGEPELQQWLYNTEGLDLSKSDSESVAHKEAPILTACGVSLDDLKQLRSVLYSTSYLDFSKQELKDQLLDLSKQHIDPETLKHIYTNLYSTSSVDLPKAVAKSTSLELMKAYAQPDQVKELYGVLYSTTGVNLPKKDAQVKAVELAKAGADPVALKNSYASAHGTKEQMLKTASDSAVRANLNYQEKRYAKDGKAYNADGFQQYYGANYLKEWGDAPTDKRIAPDSKAYSASQFRMYFQGSWESKWEAAPVATQIRLAKDGHHYTIPEFQSYYKDTWQSEWEEAPELICKECKAATFLV